MLFITHLLVTIGTIFNLAETLPDIHDFCKGAFDEWATQLPHC